MAAHFDNLDDVSSKFTGTICYYDKKPVAIKGVQPDPEVQGKFVLVCQTKGGKNQYVKLLDPLFNYKEFNLGYANTSYMASWWYRKPLKQYRQGLRHDQMGWRMSNPGHHLDNGFNFSKPFINMMENVYPEIDICRAALKDKDAGVIAFHRDFALSYDDIHDDYILEYQGRRIGSSVGHSLKDFRLTPQAQHLQEALQEVLHAH